MKKETEDFMLIDVTNEVVNGARNHALATIYAFIVDVLNEGVGDQEIKHLKDLTRMAEQLEAIGGHYPPPPEEGKGLGLGIGTIGGFCG